MQILFPGNKSISIALVLIVAGSLCFTTYKVSKKAQLDKFLKQQIAYDASLEKSNQSEITGIKAIN